MAYYSICPDCGCTLDPGEKCDCEEESICSGIHKRSQIKERKPYVKKIIYPTAYSGKSN